MSQSATLIGTGEAAELLGWSRAKVKREAKAGNLPFELRMPGATGAYVFHRSVIELFAAKQRHPSNAA